MRSGGCCGAANSRPIIGVLTQPTTHSPSFQSFGRSYLPADYVKWLEAAGARVVPVDYGASKEHLRHLFESVNGILFTGGGLDLPGSLYLRNSMLLYQWAIEANNKGDHFPLWGTCQGFEMFAIIASGNDSVLGSFSGENLALSLDFTSQARNSRMFGSLPADVYETFAMKPITQNLHHLGVSPQSFLENRGLGKAYAVLSVNKDTNGKIFVSSMEGKDYPLLISKH
ncbi:folate gamma-glutamyl hydrolase [Balamuthia mandrillaris]